MAAETRLRKVRAMHANCLAAPCAIGLIAAISPWLSPTVARCSLSARSSFVAPSRDGAAVLVMVSPYPEEDQSPTAVLPDGRVVSIRQTFPHSGVYLASTLNSVWQIDWHAQEGDLLWSDDLRSLARLDRNAVRTGGGLAFYRDGVLVKRHEWKDLLTGLRNRAFIPYTTGDWHWKWYRDFKLNPAHDQIIFSTARRHYYIEGIKDIDLGLQEFYTFDLNSGAIVSQRRVGAWRIWVYGLVGLTGIAALIFIIRGVRKLVRSSAKGRGFAIE